MLRGPPCGFGRQQRPVLLDNSFLQKSCPARLTSSEGRREKRHGGREHVAHSVFAVVPFVSSKGSDHKGAHGCRIALGVKGVSGRTKRPSCPDAPKADFKLTVIRLPSS